jgi:hypothetical protein
MVKSAPPECGSRELDADFTIVAAAINDINVFGTHRAEHLGFAIVEKGAAQEGIPHNGRDL